MQMLSEAKKWKSREKNNRLVEKLFFLQIFWRKNLFSPVFRVGGVRVARWHVFKPKIPIGVNLAGSWNGKCWRILWSFGIFYVHLVLYFMAVW
jgi:hypothetical protein